MGLGTAFHLAQKGYDVTILEKGNSVANVSYIVHIDSMALIFVYRKYEYKYENAILRYTF